MRVIASFTDCFTTIEKIGMSNFVGSENMPAESMDDGGMDDGGFDFDIGF